MLWSTPWSRQRACRYWQALRPDRVRPGCFDALAATAARLLENGREGLSIELSATWRQSSFLLLNDRRGEALLGFDVLQSLALGTMARQLAAGVEYTGAAAVLRACAALAIHEEVPYYALHVHATPIRAPGSHYPSDAADRRRLKPVLDAITRPLGDGHFLHLLDTYVLAYEVYHYLERRYPDQAEPYAADARVAFDDAVSEVCVEDRDDFEEILSYYGAIELTAAFRERTRRQMAVWRAHFADHGDRIRSEIAADAFAFAALFYESVHDRAAPLAAVYDASVQQAFIIHTLWDLHRAMVRRGVLSIDAPVRGMKPGDLGESNLRKVALVSFARRYPVYAWGKDVLVRDPALAQVVRDYARNRIWPTKATLDAMIVIPAAAALYEVLETAQVRCGRATAADGAPGSPPWFDPFALFDPDAARAVLVRPEPRAAAGRPHGGPD